MVRRGTGFDPDQAWRQLLEERQDVTPLQLPADDDLTFRINAVDLENRLGDVETDCRDRLHASLLQIVGALTAHTFMCLLYTSDAADEEDSVDLGGRRII